MFWGIGDSSKLSTEEKQTLDALRRLGETGHIVGLTPDQTKVAIAAITFYSNVTATTGIIAGARNVLLFLGSLCVMWWAVKDVVVQFIRSSAGV